jgi:hypothetical protein
MKGGITGGVVYPPAIAKIAEQYRFKNLGGTSAGTIVAALAAAPEFRRRQTQSMVGFQLVGELPTMRAAKDTAQEHTTSSVVLTGTSGTDSPLDPHRLAQRDQYSATCHRESERLLRTVLARGHREPRTRRRFHCVRGLAPQWIRSLPHQPIHHPYGGDLSQSDQ